MQSQSYGTVSESQLACLFSPSQKGLDGDTLGSPSENQYGMPFFSILVGGLMEIPWEVHLENQLACFFSRSQKGLDGDTLGSPSENQCQIHLFSIPEGA